MFPFSVFMKTKHVSVHVHTEYVYFGIARYKLLFNNILCNVSILR